MKQSAPHIRIHALTMTCGFQRLRNYGTSKFMNELIIFASVKLTDTCMINKIKTNVVVFSSNPCFHHNKTTANKRRILPKQY
jgi:hypothetical protein